MTLTRLLAVGDLHLGRRPHRLAPFVASLDACTPAAALRRVVDHAERTRANAVLFAGDLVDRDEDLFEGFAALEHAADRLVRAGIRVLAVAGNHDARVLPRLKERVPAIELLGGAGHWTSTRVGHAGIIGWSFPGRHHTTSPLDADGFDAARSAVSTAPALLGLLHADLDAAGGRYAPVRRDALRQTGLAAWLVGHVHQPDPFTGPGHVGYLGSLVGLDRGETGPRGVWEIEVSAAGRLTMAHRPMGPVHWLEHRSRLPEAAASEDALRDAALDALTAIDDELDDPEGRIDVVAVTLHLEGEVDDPAAVERAVARLDAASADLRVTRGARTLALVRLAVHVRPRIPLEALKDQRDAVGVVARLLSDLRDGTPLPAELVAAIDEAVRAATSGALARVDTSASPSRDEIVEHAIWRVLNDLRKQAQPRREA